MFLNRNYQNYNTIYTDKTYNFTFKSRSSLDSQVVESIKAFKSGVIYKINGKLRGTNLEPLTADEINIIKDLKELPRRKLTKDTYVYRGVEESCDFDPVKILKTFIGSEPFVEKGFTSVSPLKCVAKQFRYARGVLEKILLPKGTEVINIDSLLLQNIHKLSDENFIVLTRRLKRPRHEWVLLPNAKYNVINFSDKNTYKYWVDSSTGKRYRFMDGGIGTFELSYEP